MFLSRRVPNLEELVSNRYAIYKSIRRVVEGRQYVAVVSLPVRARARMSWFPSLFTTMFGLGRGGVVNTFLDKADREETHIPTRNSEKQLQARAKRTKEGWKARRAWPATRSSR